MSKVISIANQKGGVGKTTTCGNLAAALTQAGKRTLCIDFDPSGNLSDYVGYEPDGGITINELLEQKTKGLDIDPLPAIRVNGEGVEYIPSDVNLNDAEIYLVISMCREQALQRVLEHPAFSVYDYILVDCYPGLGILLTNALTASDSLIIPVQAQSWSFSSIDRLLARCEEIKRLANPRLHVEGLLLTMVDITNMSKAVVTATRERFPAETYQTEINRYAEAGDSAYAKKSLVSTKRARLGEAYTRVAGELIARHEGELPDKLSGSDVEVRIP